MTSFFLSHRYTGENIDTLTVTLQTITDTLERKGHVVFCDIFHTELFTEHKWGYNEILAYCTEQQKNYAYCLSFIHTEAESAGMNAERERARALQQPIILLIQKDLAFPLYRACAHTVIEYSDINDCVKKLDIAF